MSIDSQVALYYFANVEDSIKWSILPDASPLLSLALEDLQVFDGEVHQTFSDSMCIDPSDLFWQQAQLSLSRGGIGLHSSSQHSSAAFMASFSMSSFSTNTNHHLLHSWATSIPVFLQQR